MQSVWLSRNVILAPQFCLDVWLMMVDLGLSAFQSSNSMSEAGEARQVQKQQHLGPFVPLHAISDASFTMASLTLASMRTGALKYFGIFPYFPTLTLPYPRSVASPAKVDSESLGDFLDKMPKCRNDQQLSGDTWRTRARLKNKDRDMGHLWARPKRMEQMTRNSRSSTLDVEREC